jgi:hypothetical protein
MLRIRASPDAQIGLVEAVKQSCRFTVDPSFFTTVPAPMTRLILNPLGCDDESPAVVPKQALALYRVLKVLRRH